MSEDCTYIMPTISLYWMYAALHKLHLTVGRVCMYVHTYMHTCLSELVSQHCIPVVSFMRYTILNFVSDAFSYTYIEAL